MPTSVTALTLGGFDHLPAHARRCVFWEIDPAVVSDARGVSDPVFEKEAWLSTVMLEWGSCGQVAVVDGKAAGCAFYAPPRVVPRASLFPTSPVSPDAILLTTLRVERPYRDCDIANRLVQAAVADLIRRGVRAIEAFGIHMEPETAELPTPSEGSMRLVQRINTPVSGIPSVTAAPGGGCTPESCMIDAAFLEDVGFTVVAPHHRFPRLRMALTSGHLWKEDVEHALDQLISTTASAPETRVGCS